MKQTSETFLSVPGYEGLYEVSNKGNVKSLRRGIILKPSILHGYLRVGLHKDNKNKLRLTRKKLVCWYWRRFPSLYRCHNTAVVERR